MSAPEGPRSQRMLFDELDESARQDRRTPHGTSSRPRTPHARPTRTTRSSQHQDQVPRPPGQLLPPRPIVNSVIRASAGTGKTFQLSNRYLQLIVTGHPPERILATTFTRKAAGEILNRVLFRLAMAAETPKSADRLAAELDLPDLTVDVCRQALSSLTTELHRLKISTLDAFFLQAATMMSLELGLPPGSRVAEPGEVERLQQLAISEVLSEGEQHDLQQLLNWLSKGESQRSIQGLLTDSVQTMSALFLASPTASWERVKRQRSRLGDEWERHVKALEQWPVPDDATKTFLKAFDRFLQFARTQQWSAMLSSGIGKKLADGDRTYARRPLPTTFVDLADDLVQHATAETLNRLILQTEASRELLKRFQQRFDHLKREHRLFEFSDLARYLTQLDQNQDHARLAFRLDTRIESLLLDEFQDTSFDQWCVLRPFARRIAAEAGESDATDSNVEHSRRRSFLCVGDGKQAIYGWRGGDAELLEALPDEVQPSEQQRLDRSFRSAPPIIEFVNRVHQGMVAHPNLEKSDAAVKQWCREFPEHETARADLSGYVSVETCAPAEDLEGRRIASLEAAAERVARLRETAPHFSVAVLVRVNQMVGQVIYELQKRGIPASEEGGSRLTDAAAVQLIVSLLTLADHPLDTVAQFHLACSPWRQQLGLNPPQTPIPENTGKTSAMPDRQVLQLVEQVRLQLANRGYGETVAEWARQLASFAKPREQRRLAQLVDLAYQHQQQIESPRQIGFARQVHTSIATREFVQLIERHRFSDPSEDPVRVMNIHQSKGLQFDAVVLPDLDRQLLGQTPNCIYDRPSATEPIDIVFRYVNQDIRRLMPAAGSTSARPLRPGYRA